MRLTFETSTKRREQETEKGKGDMVVGNEAMCV